MKLLTGSAIVSTVALVCWTDSKLDQWEGEQQAMAQILLKQPKQDYEALQSWADLPANVQQYLNRVLPLGHYPAEGVKVQQEGDFLMTKDQYVPFTAQQVISSNPPGFSWEGKISLAPSVPSWFPKVFVSDSWVNGIGQFHATVQAIVPTTHIDGTANEKTLALGQATRWLADAVLLPSSLQPHAGRVKWSKVEGSSASNNDDSNNNNNNKAILELPIANIRGLQVEATFDEQTGLLTQVMGQKPLTTEMRSWQVNFFDYQQQENGMHVPLRMESGWINDEGDFEAYYKIDNRSFRYHYAPAASSSDEATISQA